MNRKKLFSRAGIGLGALAAVFAAAVAAEIDGYRFFDRPDGGNLLCSLDPSCRKLTPGEIDMARIVFGEAIDYRSVKLFHRDYMRFIGPKDKAMTPNGDIYIPGKTLWSRDFSAEGAASRKFFMHELTHVWQSQTGKTVPAEALDAYVRNDFDYDASYNYTLKDHRLFQDYNIEQQASMVEDYTGQRLDLEDMLDPLDGTVPDPVTVATLKARQCADLQAYEEKIGQVLPLQRETACPEKPLPPKKRGKARHLHR